MDNIYGNVDCEFSASPGKERRHHLKDVSDPTGPRSSKETMKFVPAILGLLLLCALVALCVLAILYSIKSVSFEGLSEQYRSAIERLSLLQHNSSEFKSHVVKVQRNYEDALKRLESLKETERKYEALKGKYRTAQEVFSNCGECQKCACGEGWRSFGGKCYYFSTEQLNWMESRDVCAEKGGQLVVITSQAEQDFLFSQVHGNHWIGLNDLETEGRWMWVNNQALAETGVEFWYKRSENRNEPDNWREDDPSGENCGELDTSGRWFDASCSKMKKYICE